MTEPQPYGGKVRDGAWIDAVERDLEPLGDPALTNDDVRDFIATVRAAWEERDEARTDLALCAWNDGLAVGEVIAERKTTIAALKVEVARLRGMVRSGINGLGAPNYGGRERRALAERLQDALAAPGEREEPTAAAQKAATLFMLGGGTSDEREEATR